MWSDVSDDFGTFIEASFYNPNCRGPYSREFYNLSVDYRTKKGVMEFNGYCYIPPEEFPIERTMTVREMSFNYTAKKQRHYLHMRITSKEELEDTSEYSYDEEEGGSICFFPTNRIRLHFDVLPMPMIPAELERIPVFETYAFDMMDGSGATVVSDPPPHIEIRPINSTSSDVEVGSVIDLE